MGTNNLDQGDRATQSNVNGIISTVTMVILPIPQFLWTIPREINSRYLNAILHQIMLSQSQEKFGGDSNPQLSMSRKLSVRPIIGVRAKLRTKHGGHFGATSGEKGKFGLTSLEIVGIVRKLQKLGMLA